MVAKAAASQAPMERTSRTKPRIMARKAEINRTMRKTPSRSVIGIRLVSCGYASVMFSIGL
jgi:hypothetical protein